MNLSVPTPRIRRFRGFTLIELLVVVAIIALLAAILFPVFSAARDRARQSACSSNMKQLGLGMLQYLQDYDEKTLATENVGGNSKGWAGRLFTYVKNTQTFVCPSDTRTTTGLGNTSVNGVNRPNYLVSYAFNQSVRGPSAGASAKDGIVLSSFTSPPQTVALFELDASKAPIMEPEEITSQGHQGAAGGGYVAVMGVMDNATGYSGDDGDLRHKTGMGANVLFWDGHVKFLKAEKVSCGVTPNNGTAAQYSGPGTCAAADGSFPARCAEAVGYNGANKHQATMSYR